MSEEDFYKALGVEPSADQAAIKKAYRALARTYHPDRNPGDEAAADKFKDAAEAYRVLGDEELRAQYDAYKNGTGTADNPEELFGDIFGTRPVGRERRRDVRRDPKPSPRGGRTGQRRKAQRRGESRYKERGDDLRYRLELDFQEAAMGGRREITIPRNATCRICGGTGADQNSAPVVCNGCRGTGSVRVQEGFFDRTERCPQCSGSGRRVGAVCSTCVGEGIENRMERIEVDVPAGVAAGTRLRFAGQGQPGAGGGEPGDLVVEVAILADSLFERDEADLLVEVPVPFTLAALGGPVDIPTLDGKVRMRIPPGSQSGRVFRLKGKGLPDKHGQRGDQRVRIVVEVPEQLSHRQQQLLEEFAAEGLEGGGRVERFRQELARRYGNR